MAEFTIALFAGARESVGRSTIVLQCDSPIDAGQLKQLVAQSFPDLVPYAQFGRLAVDREFVDDSSLVHANSEPNSSVIALIPPVSGG